MITVEIEPGPASSGIASGTTAMLSLSSASIASSGVCRLRLWRACIIDTAISINRMPPPTRNDAIEMPNTRSSASPTTADTTSTTAIASDVWFGILRRSAGLRPVVRLM